MFVTTLVFNKNWLESDPYWYTSALNYDIAIILRNILSSTQSIDEIVEKWFTIAYDPIEEEYFPSRESQKYPSIIEPLIPTNYLDIAEIFLHYGPLIPPNIVNLNEFKNIDLHKFLDLWINQYTIMQRGIEFIDEMMNPKYDGQSRLMVYTLVNNDNTTQLQQTESRLLILREALEYIQSIIQNVIENTESFLQEFL